MRTRGFELELLAPTGQSRLDIAKALSRAFDCSMSEIFHRESDLKVVKPGEDPFYCLTRGFLLNSDSVWFKVVNDMTIFADLNPALEESEDWYHILADDIRFIDLITANCSPSDTSLQLLHPIAKLFRTRVIEQSGMHQVFGSSGKVICLQHHRFRDRCRICEVVTSPYGHDYDERLRSVLATLQKEGCLIPKESAFHVHYDAKEFYQTTLLLRLIRYVHVWSPTFKAILPPNPYWQRTGSYSPEVIEYAFEQANQHRSWTETVQSLKQLGVTKFCDVNISNIVYNNPEKPTVEFRIIPMIFNADALIAGVQLFSAFLSFVIHTDVVYNQQTTGSADDIQQLMNSLDPFWE